MDISTVITYIKELIATVMTLLMMLSPAFTGTAETYSAERPDELITSFAVVSDIHVETNNPNIYTKLKDVLVGVKAGEDIDSVLYTGDNVMNGQVLENAFFYSAVRAVKPAENNFVATGNHDLGNGEGTLDSYRSSFIFNNNYVLGNDIDELYYYKVVNGCYMIFLSSEELCVNDYVIGDEQMEWLKGVLDEAQAANAPIFVINHHPIYLIRDRDYRELAWLLQKYDNLLYLHGHYHSELSTDSFYSWHNVDCINVPRATEHKDYEAGQGLVIEVYDDEIVVRARNFINNEWMDEFRYTY